MLSKTLGRVSAGILAAAGMSVHADLITPFLPQEKPFINYSGKTCTASSLKIPLNSGVTLTPGNFVSEKSLDGAWKISGLTNSAQPFPDDIDLDKGFSSPDFNDEKWDTIAVPLDWYRKYPQMRKCDKDGKTCSKPYIKGWYRLKFNISEQDLREKSVTLHFGVAPYSARLFVNGRAAGANHGDFTPWDVNISEFLKPGENTLALRLFSDFGPKYSAAAENIWTAQGTLVSKSVPKATHTYGSQWGIDNIKGGLWQGASLRFAPKIYFKRILVNPVLKDSSIKVDYVISNTSGREQQLDLGAAVVSAIAKDSQLKIADTGAKNIKLQPGDNDGEITVILNKPELWSPDNPYMYWLALYIAQDSKLQSAGLARFGFREFKVSGRDFLLNGKGIYLFGENLPSVRLGGVGQDDKLDFQKSVHGFKSLGYNIIRTPHMPMAEVFDIADECGLMIMDEWAWSFTSEIDEPVFEKNNLEEIPAWIYRDYNHPSVTVWSGGNEVVHKNPVIARQLDKQVQLIRKLDKSGRPVNNFSGSGTCVSYGEDKLDTDMIDLHDYIGLSHPVWTAWSKWFKPTHYNKTLKAYAKDGTLDMPYIVWECVGFSWGQTPNAKFKVNDISQYAAYAAKETSWGQPNGIGFAGTIGLAAALDLKSGLDYGKEVYGRRMLEQIRQTEEIQGFAPWFHGSSLKMALLWTQPVFCGLRDADSVMIRNAFTGREIKQKLFVINSSNDSFRNLSAEISLTGPDGASSGIKTIQIASLKEWERFSEEIAFSLPEQKTAGWGQLRIVLKDGEKEISRNFYDLYIQSPSILTSPVGAKLKAAVIDTGAEKDIAAFLPILSGLSVKFDLIQPDADFSPYKLVIIPPVTPDSKLKAYNPGHFLEWVRQGGLLLVMEQSGNGVRIIENCNLVGGANTFVDLAVPAHPVFAGLNQNNFDTWSRPDGGLIINTMLDPFSINALAVRGPMLGSKQVGNAVMEGSFGNGRIFCTQLLASSLWGKDASASFYLRNLIAYMAGGQPPLKAIQPLAVTKSRNFSIDPQNAVQIDLKSSANRSFTDEVDSDGKGGWTDQGPNDFRNMPLGRQTAAGVPFEIIDPAKNNGKSCVILRGKQRQQFPESVTGIPVNEKFSRIFFMHTCAWSMGREVAVYKINYEGGKSADFALIEGKNISDWWSCSSTPQAQLGISRVNAINQSVCAFVTCWENPHPQAKIISIDFISAGDAVPVLIAVTGEKISENPLVIEKTGVVSSKWSEIAWKGGPKPSAGVTACADSPSGKTAVKVSMPDSKGEAEPVLMISFSKDKLASGNWKSLTFWIKPESGGELSFVLPEKDWKGSLTSKVRISDKIGAWTKVRLNLNEDMGMKNKKFGLKDLRGELFIYNVPDSLGGRPAANFFIDNIAFE